MTKGFVILAQNTADVDYVKCAEVLAQSIKAQMPSANVSLISDNTTLCKAFDQVIKLPYGDIDPTSNWKLSNDWQVYEASPYEYTIKLEADLYLPSSIDHWWHTLQQRDVVISTTIRNFRQDISTSRAYRKFIDDNALPDCYNAITYFKKSDTARLFFEVVRDIFENWNQYIAILKCNRDELPTTDWVYAIASHIVGIEKTTLPNFTAMSMVHMKQFINDLPTADWTDTFVYEILPHTLRVNTSPQLYPFHYQLKNFCDKISKSLYAR
jgi:hypothetical protein